MAGENFGHTTLRLIMVAAELTVQAGVARKYSVTASRSSFGTPPSQGKHLPRANASVEGSVIEIYTISERNIELNRLIIHDSAGSTYIVDGCWRDAIRDELLERIIAFDVLARNHAANGREMSLRMMSPPTFVTDIESSFHWFEKLGWKRVYSCNEHRQIGAGRHEMGENEHGGATAGGVSRDGQLICFANQPPDSTNKVSSQHLAGHWFWWLDSTDDVDARYMQAMNPGMHVSGPPTDLKWGCREFRV